MRTAGFDGTRRVIALRGLLSYVIGALPREHLGALAGPGTATIAAPADFPVLAETGRDAAAVSPGDEFAGGLEILLRGLTPRGGQAGRSPSMRSQFSSTNGVRSVAPARR